MPDPANATADDPRPRSLVGLLLLAVALSALFVLFSTLGTWQVHRRAWKLDLIQRVDQRVHAAPVPAPLDGQARRVSGDDEYRHVRIDGRLLDDRSVQVQAVTEQGPGFWLMTPLQTDDGFIVMINRGFVESVKPQPQSPVNPTTRISGLLRLTEPTGGFLRRNDPSAGLWYSRDVAAIAAAENLPTDRVAPYFIDADATPDTLAGQPVGGLTVIRFHNSHLVYAITWYALALMTVTAMVVVGRQEWRSRTLHRSTAE